MNQSSSRQRSSLVDVAFECTTEGLAGLEKVVELNMQTVKTSLSEQQALADAAVSAQSVSEVIDLQSRQFPAGVKKTFAYLRHVEEIAVSMGNGLFSAMHENIGNSFKNFAEMVEVASAGIARQQRFGQSSLLLTEQPAVAIAEPVAILDSSGKVVSSGHEPGDLH